MIPYMVKGAKIMKVNLFCLMFHSEGTSFSISFKVENCRVKVQA